MHTIGVLLLIAALAGVMFALAAFAKNQCQ